MADPDLTEALEAAAEVYAKQHWTEGITQQFKASPDPFEMYRIKQALLPLIAAAAPFIASQQLQRVRALADMWGNASPALLEQAKIASAAGDDTLTEGTAIGLRYATALRAALDGPT